MIPQASIPAAVARKASSLLGGGGCRRATTVRSRERCSRSTRLRWCGGPPASLRRPQASSSSDHSFSSSAPSSTSASDASGAGATTHFGFREVPLNDKEGQVRQVFDRVADSYDVMNDLMSGGLHRVWKDRLLEISNVADMAEVSRRLNHPLRILDVAGGTGDVAFRFVDAAGCAERSKSTGDDPVQVTVCDINAEMLRVGERRARHQYGNALLDSSKALRFVQGNAQHLVDFDSDTFDVYTIAFGLRNVTLVDDALKEAHRVLKPGGRFFCLEFSKVPNPLLQAAYDAYSFRVIPAMGDIVAGDRDSYQYLVESIRRFADPDGLLHRMRQAGFAHAKYANLAGGIVALHEGYKPW